MKRNLLFFLLLSIVLMFNACVKENVMVNNQQPIVVPRASTIEVPPPPPKVVTPVSNIIESHQVQTIQGNILTIQEKSNGFFIPQYQGKIILLQIFGKECPYCFKEMPTINHMKRKYAGKLQIIALHAQDTMSKQTASRIIREHQMNYPIIDKEEARPLLYTIQDTYGWTGVLPYMLLIKDGVTEYSFAGDVSHQELDESIRSLM